VFSTYPFFKTNHGFGQYNHLFTDRFFGYARIEALHDGIADLQYRITVGPGVGYDFIKETNTTLAGEVGCGFIDERLGDVDDNYAALRVVERFEHKFSTAARIWQSIECDPQDNKFDNYLIIGVIGVEAAITKRVGLTTSLQDNFDNVPAPGRQKNDVKLISGLTYNSSWQHWDR
jgi:putative salt-induced outer membrane protein YdiY